MVTLATPKVTLEDAEAKRISPPRLVVLSSKVFIQI
jgi:hypothetical protein